jgi:hypothetical protein
MANVAWERCVREVTLSANPEVVGSLAGGWTNLATAFTHLRDALVGRAFVGPVAPGEQRPNVNGLTNLLASWQGSGGDAYRDHLNELGKEIEDLVTHSANVSGALSRIESDIRKAIASIPIPLMDDFGWNEWSLPNGTELDDADDGASAAGFLRALRKDYQSDPGAYADGAFRDKADDLEATMKVDGKAADQERGGWWDTKSHLDNWYRDNQQAANSAMSPLPKAVETERPKLVVPPPDGFGPLIDDRRPDLGDTPPVGKPSIGTPSGSVGTPSVGTPSVGTPSIGATPKVGTPSIGTPDTASLPHGSGYPSGNDYGTGLAGVGDGGGFRSVTGGLGGLGATGVGGVGGLGSTGGIGAGGGFGSTGGVGAAAGVGAGVVPGLVGGGNGKMPPLTSAASALRSAMANAAGPKAPGGGMGGAAMMGGGGLGGFGSGQREEHKSWLTEDEDPWGTADDVPPGIIR